MSTRREFLRKSAAVGGGLLVAIQIPGCAEGPAGAATLANPTSPVQANAWLRVNTDGSVAFLCDKSEMGQGVYTSLTTIVAEELDVPADSIKFEAAPPGDQYINTILGTQVTGGSTSVREAWTKLRHAAADTRARLVAAAAEHWNFPAGELRTDNGAIVSPGGERLSYGQLATAAAALPAPANVALKPVSAFTQVGKSRTRLDTPSKLNGTAAYGIDQRFPGMLFGAIAQSPVLGGKALSVDDAQARTMPGVRQIVQTSGGVVVLADSWWQARKARDALTVTWDPGANATLSTASISAGLAQALDTRSAEAKLARNDGDADAALGKAKKIEAIYELPLLAHATLEPQNCTVVPQGDELHLYVPTQVQLAAQASAAAASGLPPEKVFIHTTYLGGGFGRRLEVDFIPAAVEAARAANVPVKLLWTREDDTTHDYYRPPYRHRCSAAFNDSGKLAAWKFEICGPSVTSRWAPAAVATAIDPFVLEAATNYPYDADNVKVSFLQHEIGINVGYLRSVSHATNCFAAECFMDELAYAANKDPYEFRRALLENQSEPRWRAVLERAAARAGWGKAAEGRHQGIALMEGYGTYLALVAEISLDAGKVRVHKISGAVDLGQMVNPAIVDSQIRSGIVFGLSATLWGDITIENGIVQQKNFDTYRLLRMNELPEIDVEIIQSGAEPGGIGEPTVAPVAPAIYNALYAATKQRLRSLPLSRHGFA